MKTDQPVTPVYAVLPAHKVDRPCCNDMNWDPAGGFDPVRAALSDDIDGATVQALTQALRQSAHPAEFRRWLRLAIGRAARTELPLLCAYQRYFEQQARSADRFSRAPG